MSAPGDLFLFELDYVDPSTSDPGVLRVANRPFQTSGTDTPQHEGYDGCLSKASGYSIQAFDNGTTFGASKVGGGSFTLANGDRHLNFLRRMAINGGAFRFLVGQPPYAYPGDFTRLIVGQADRLSVGDEVKIEVKDGQAVLMKPLQTTVFLGNNVLPNGVEGTGELANKVVQGILGKVREVTAPCVNTSKNVHLASAWGLSTISRVSVRGNIQTLSGAGNYSSIADMIANAPSPGEYRLYMPAGGPCYIRLSTTPDGPVTFDAAAAGTSADWSAAKLMKQAALQAGIDAANISSGDVAALHSDNPAVCGFVVTNETARQVMDKLAESVGAAYWMDSLGVLRMARLEPPAGGGASVLSLGPEIVDVTFGPTGDPTRGIPVKRVFVDYRRYWTVQASNVATAAGAARIADLAQEYRREKSSDPSVEAIWTNAPDLTRVTCLDDKSDAQDEADRCLDLYGPRGLLSGDPTGYATVTACIDPADMPLLQPTAEIDITWGDLVAAPARVLSVMSQPLDNNLVTLGVLL